MTAIALAAGAVLLFHLHGGPAQTSASRRVAASPAAVATSSDAAAPNSIVSPSIPTKQKVVVRQGMAADPVALAAAASAVKLWEPQTPADAVKGFEEADKSLVACVSLWQNKFADGDVERPETLPLVRQALAKSRLTPEQCILMTKLLAEWEDGPGGRDTGYKLMTGAFASQAIFSAKAKITLKPEGRQALMTLISPLIRRLWAGQADDMLAVEQFYYILAAYEPPKSSEWFRGNLGQIEAMGRREEADAALALATQVENEFPEMSEPQRAKLDYDEGTILFGVARFREAAATFPAAAHSIGWKENRGDARALLVMSLALSQQIVEARRERDALARSDDQTVLAAEANITLSTAIERQSLLKRD